MFPIASSLAEQLGVPQRLMSVAVMLGGSAGWILPYSYQCNLMGEGEGVFFFVFFSFLLLRFRFFFWLSLSLFSRFSHDSNHPLPSPPPFFYLFFTVYSAGNYRTVDFLKIGAPLTFWLLLGTAVILGFPDQWYIPLAASSAAMALSVAGPVAVERFQQRRGERRRREKGAALEA